MGWPANRCGEPVRLGEPCSSTPTPADPLAQLLAAVLAHRPQPRAWPHPRPPYLPHPRVAGDQNRTCGRR